MRRDSNIKVETVGDEHIITVPYAPRNPDPTLITVVIALLFFPMWFSGLARVVSTIGIFSDDPLGGFQRLALVWLGLTLVITILMVFIFFRITNKSKPETIRLAKRTLTANPGRPFFPPEGSFRWWHGARRRNGDWIIDDANKLLNGFIANHPITIFTLEEINSLQCRDAGKRLTIDKGVKRLDIGVGATPEEKQWLYDYIFDYYHSTV